jgi:hypothetical protein
MLGNHAVAIRIYRYLTNLFFSHLLAPFSRFSNFHFFAKVFFSNMTSTLTVIGLVTRLKSSSQIIYGEAVYREKVSNDNIVFGFKQFTNAMHEYNESFREGDLVLFGGKFTIDDQKLLVSIGFM